MTLMELILLNIFISTVVSGITIIYYAYQLDKMYAKQSEETRAKLLKVVKEWMHDEVRPLINKDKQE